MKSVLLLVFMLGVISCEDNSFQYIYIKADESSGIEVGTPLTYKGLNIGVVSNLSIANDEVLIEIQLYHEVKVYSEAKITRIPVSVLGDVELALTSNKGDVLKPDDTLRGRLIVKNMIIHSDKIKQIVDTIIKEQLIKQDTVRTQKEH